MPNAMLAGLPRLVRVADEVRARGQATLSVGAAVAVYWVCLWLLDQPVSPLRTLIALLIAGLPASLMASVGSGRRLAAVRKDLRPPPRVAVYETIADGRERRARLAGILLLAAVVLLVFDRLTTGEGTMAGLTTGFFISVGVVDLLEARRWAEAERARAVRLYVVVRPNAMVASYGPTDVYEVPRADADRDEEPVESGFER
ncbi:MAG: hypothetical protein QOK40_2108 [Miltoncostaeaceae bacterium]|nr:hypothetical protein [Miltoncostaeaceae bacterium]